MHKLRINIYDHPTIMIKLPEAFFGITRQYAKVGHKNINICSDKNHLGRFCINGIQSIKKIYNITLCNFWHRS
jgi:hypothetical protein